MKGKQSLLLVAFVAILLVALIVVPAVASAAPGGSGGGKPVNWASFVCDSNNDDPAFRTMDAIHVQKLQDETVRGKYLDQFTGKPGELEYRFSSRNFESEYWGALVGPTPSYAYFGHAADYPEELWPSGWLWGLPSNWSTFAGADIADFVVYVPRVQLPPLWLPLVPDDADSLPVRYVLLDFGEPGAGNDLYMVWVFASGVWWPPLDSENNWLLDPVPVPNGNIQVHVGAPDF